MGIESRSAGFQPPQGEPRRELITPFPVNELVIARDYGACGGVLPSVEMVDFLTRTSPNPVVTDNDIVHNKRIMDELTAKGFRNIGNSWQDEHFDGTGQTFVVSAHGGSWRKLQALEQKGFEVVNTTCMLVARVHRLISMNEALGMHIINIGVSGHPETESYRETVHNPQNYTLVETEEDVAKLDTPEGQQVPQDKFKIVFTQTTLMPSQVEGIEAKLQEKYQDSIIIPKRGDICPATMNRQAAVEEIAATTDTVLVIGSPHSHNSKMLKATAERRGGTAHLFDYPEEIDERWFDKNTHRVGLTAGASVLDRFIDPVIDWFKQKNPDLVITNLNESRDKSFKLLPETQAVLDRLRGIPDAQVTATRMWHEELYQDGKFIL